MSPLLNQAELAREFEPAPISLSRTSAARILDKSRSALGYQETIEAVVIPALERIGNRFDDGSISLAQKYMCGRVCEDVLDRLFAGERPGQHKIGGDFYELVELGPDRVAVGDVCGKGLQAATYNAMMKYMLRAFLREGLDPAECLIRLNGVVLDEMPLDKFVTMGLAFIETKSGKLLYSSAGHPHPIVNTGLEAAVLDIPKTVPLGVLDNYKFSTVQTSLSQSCSLLMYTDGIIEARAPNGVQFGPQRLLTAFNCGPGLSAQEIAEHLLSQVLNFSQGELKDDAALLVLRGRSDRVKNSLLL